MSDSTPESLPVGKVAVGDCLEAMADWPENSVDLIFSDPPYNIGYQYDAYEDTRDDADYIQWTRDWIDGCARLLKPAGSMYILIGDEYAAETRLHLKRLQREMDSRNYNGASLVGLDGIVVKSHGSADELAFLHAIETAVVEVEHDVPSQIGRLLQREAA